MNYAPEVAVDLVELLGFVAPGQDVKLLIRHAERRELSGYWVWDPKEQQHIHTTKKSIKLALEKTGLAHHEYHSNVLHRTWRYKDAMRLLEEYRTGIRLAPFERKKP